MTLLSFFYLVITGSIAGMMAGFMGIGGGAILTPLCLLIYPALGIGGKEIIRVIFGTNMFLVALFSLSAALKHHVNNKIDWRTVVYMTPLAVVGSYIGAWTATIVSAVLLKKAFAILLTVSAVLLIARGSTKPSASILKKGMLPHRFILVLGFLTGFLGSFLGIGGGVIMVPALILLFAYPVDKVAATSSSIIIFIGISGMISYMMHGGESMELPGWSTGYVWWSAALPLAIGGVPAARLGAALNAKTHDKTLQRVFGAVLFILALKMFLS